MLILRRAYPESDEIFSVIAQREGHDHVVGAISVQGGVYPPAWQWVIQILTQPVLPAPTIGTATTRAEAMRAFRVRWGEVFPLIGAADWQRNRAMQEAAHQRDEAWHAHNPHFPRR